MFVTVFLARYEPHASRLRYASAGHNEMVLMRANGEVQLLSGRGHPLGVRPSHLLRYVGGEVDIGEGDMLALYTDGVVEAFGERKGVDGDLEEFGLSRLLGELRARQTAPTGAIVDGVYEVVQRFSGGGLQSDDFTMLVARFHGVPAGLHSYAIRLPAVRESVPMLRQQLGEHCLRHGISGELLDDILLVGDEAASNIVVHAYGDRQHPDEFFECNLQIESNRLLRMHFRDRGRPFSAEEVRSPDVRENLSGRRKGGFGVYLIKALMSEVRYERRDDENLLAIEKDLRRV